MMPSRRASTVLLVCREGAREWMLTAFAPNTLGPFCVEPASGTLVAPPPACSWLSYCAASHARAAATAPPPTFEPPPRTKFSRSASGIGIIPDFKRASIASASPEEVYPPLLRQELGSAPAMAGITSCCAAGHRMALADEPGRCTPVHVEAALTLVGLAVHHGCQELEEDAVCIFGSVTGEEEEEGLAVSTMGGRFSRGASSSAESGRLPFLPILLIMRSNRSSKNQSSSDERK